MLRLELVALTIPVAEFKLIPVCALAAEELVAALDATNLIALVNVGEVVAKAEVCNPPSSICVWTLEELELTALVFACNVISVLTLAFVELVAPEVTDNSCWLGTSISAVVKLSATEFAANVIAVKRLD